MRGMTYGAALLVLVCAAGAAASGGRFDARPVLSIDCAAETVSAGWRLTAGQAGEAAGRAAVPRRVGDAFVAAGGLLESPEFPVESFRYYRLRFTAKTAAPGEWGAVFYEENGAARIEDNYCGFDPSDDWREHEFFFRGRIRAVRARIVFTPGRGGVPALVRNVEVVPAARSTVAAWADRLYAAMPPLKAVFSADRRSSIPRTIERLLTGGRLRIVFLGDSIANDIGNSPFDVLLERLHPGTAVETVNSVRGSTGCGWYQRNDRVKEYAVEYRPDLLVVAGISNGPDPEAVRSVIRQVRAVIRPEIVVMSPAVGRIADGDPRVNAAWTFAVAPDGRSFRSRLMKMCAEEGVEFFDMAGFWGQYILDAGKPYEWYQRDEVHANARGKQVLARIIESWFAP